ncbi:MAG: sugar ABC transporter ATP-binding protein [Chloroflexi bacterium]|nr:sugar ABC transporter ATP-binding protein [Chloroflexota bacterium]
MADTPLLEMQHISKSFFGVKVLDDVPLTLYPGEVLALLGENGAGKSTLIKILNGDYQRDTGDILIEGRPVAINEPRDAEMLGIRMIYQELHYAPDLSVMENLLVGSLPRRRGRAGRFFIDWKEARRFTTESLKLLDVSIPPDALMRDLTVVERQIVEIVKSLSREARIIVMDEPTAALTPPEVDRLFQIVERLRCQNVAIIYISHRLDEIFRVAQRLMVLRDGRHVATRRVDEVTPAELVELMVGRKIEERIPSSADSAGSQPVALEVSGLTKQGAFEDIGFTIRRGEILGIFGLLGSGQFNLTRAIFGAEKADRGIIRVEGRAYTIAHPQEGKNAGIGFVPVDRKVNGLVLGLSVRKNVTLSNWRNLVRAGFFRQGLERQHTQHWIEQLEVRITGDMEVPVRFLSGGNQQKVILARWLEANVKVLVLNEPTWGVDVGARADIYDQLEQLAERGLAILIVSSDIQEILSISHRILTIYKGRLTGEFSRAEASKERLLQAAAGGGS